MILDGRRLHTSRKGFPDCDGSKCFFSLYDYRRAEPVLNPGCLGADDDLLRRRKCVRGYNIMASAKPAFGSLDAVSRLRHGCSVMSASTPLLGWPLRNPLPDAHRRSRIDAGMYKHIAPPGTKPITSRKKSDRTGAFLLRRPQQRDHLARSARSTAAQRDGQSGRCSTKFRSPKKLKQRREVFRCTRRFLR